MSELRLSERIPKQWDDLCGRHDSFFSCDRWHRLLRSSFRCRTVYGYTDDFGVALSLFGAGPIRIAYLGFPSGSVVGPRRFLAAALPQIPERGVPGSPLCLRIPVSGFARDPEIDLPHVATPETAITDLQSWDSEQVSKKLRRDLRKAERAGASIEPLNDPALGRVLYEMYAGAVKRHRGSLRYPAEYFAALIELSRSDDRLRVAGAVADDALIGFAVSVRERDTTFYLHGGSTPAGRHLSASDLLLKHLIEHARAGGSTSFNLMSSPPGQPALVRYKEKWGGVTREHRTYTLPLSRLYTLFSAAESLYRKLR